MINKGGNLSEIVETKDKVNLKTKSQYTSRPIKVDLNLNDRDDDNSNYKVIDSDKNEKKILNKVAIFSNKSLITCDSKNNKINN